MKPFWLLPAALAGTLFPAAAGAAPQPPAGPYYVELRGGPALMLDSQSDSAGVPFEIQYDLGYAGEAALGYTDRSGFTVEMAFSFRYNEVDDLALGGTSYKNMGVAVDGQVWSAGALGSLIYRFAAGAPVEPFLGGGLGVAMVGAQIDLNGLPMVDDEALVVAYQGVAGVNFNFNRVTAVSLSYRYFGTSKPQFTETGGNTLTSEYGSQSVMLGLVMKF